MSEYSVEIERLVMRLENLFVEGASLEPTLLERIRRNVDRFEEMSKKDTDTVYIWWNDLNNDFIRLNQNYKDYMRDLNSAKAVELMHTKEFLVFKDRLVEYLRSFIKGLQRNVGVIEETLRTLDSEVCEQVFEKVINYELSIPRIGLSQMALTKTRQAGFLMRRMKLFERLRGMQLELPRKMHLAQIEGKNTEK